MADEKRNQQLDAMLDEMLANYSAVEPRPGFEQRLAATLRGTQPERRWFEFGGWAWGMVATATALLLIATYVFWPAPKPGPQQAVKAPQKELMPMETGQVAQPKQPEVAGAGGATLKHQAVHRSRAVMANAAVPKLETFPARAPLTNEEKLLMSYMARTPQQELIAQSRPDEPLAPELDEGFPATPQNLNTQRNSR